MKKIIYLIIIGLIAVSTASAQMSWNDVLKEAKDKNPTLIKAEESLNQAELYYKMSFSNFLPQVSASAGDSRNSSGLTNSYSFGLSGRLAVFSGFSNITETGIKKLDLKVEQEQYRRAVSDVIYNLRKSYVNLLLTQDMINLSSEIYSRRLKNFDLIRLKYDAGREDKGALMRVEADKLQAEYELNQNKRNLQTASAQLFRDMGIERFEVVAVTGSFSVRLPYWDMDYKVLMEHIPEYLIAKYNLDKSLLSIKSAKSDFYPGISLSASTSRSGEDFPLDGPSWNAGLSLSLPLFTGGRNYFNVKIAEINRNIFKNSAQETALQLRASLVSAWNSLVSSIENVRIKETYMRASEEQSKITTVKYLNGLVSYYDWYNVENDFINAQKSSLSAKSDAFLAEASWKKTLGIGE